MITISFFLLSLLSIWADTFCYVNGFPDLSSNRWEGNSLLEGRIIEQLEEIRKVRQDVILKGCQVNVCFAIQGGDAVTNVEYRNQVDFAGIVTNIMSGSGTGWYAGMQYTSRAIPISVATQDKTAYLKDMRTSTRESGPSYIASGIKFCSKELNSLGEEDNKMVVIGNGFDTVGDFAVNSAIQFLNDGGDVCTITVGDIDETALKEMTRNARGVFKIDDFSELGDIIVEVVTEICELEEQMGRDPIIL